MPTNSSLLEINKKRNQLAVNFPPSGAKCRQRAVSLPPVVMGVVRQHAVARRKSKIKLLRFVSKVFCVKPLWRIADFVKKNTNYGSALIDRP